MKTRQPLASYAVVFALATGAFLTAGAASAAAQPGPGRGQRGGGGFERMAERLDLSEDQKQAINALREEHRAQQLENRKQIAQLEAQLHTLMLADAPDEGAALKLVGQIGELRVRQQSARVKMRLAIRKQLTPEQRTRFILMESRFGKDRPGRGPRAGHGFPGEGPGQGRPGWRQGPSGRGSD